MNANLTSICPAALNRCPEVVERLGSLAKQLVPLSARAHGNLVAWPARRANRGCGRPSSAASRPSIRSPRKRVNARSEAR